MPRSRTIYGDGTLAVDNLRSTMKALDRVSKDLAKTVKKAGKEIIDNPIVSSAQDNYRGLAAPGWKSHATKAVRPSSGVTGVGVKLRAASFREAASLEFGALVHKVPRGNTGGSATILQRDLSRRLAPKWIGNQSLGTDFAKLPGYVVQKAMKDHRRESFERWQKETVEMVNRAIRNG